MLTLHCNKLAQIYSFANYGTAIYTDFIILGQKRILLSNSTFQNQENLRGIIANTQNLFLLCYQRSYYLITKGCSAFYANAN